MEEVGREVIDSNKFETACFSASCEIGGMGDSVNYVAIVRDVKEVVLQGTADLKFWTEKLAMHGLMPEEQHGGRASILISAARLRWMGVSFSEVSICVVAQSSGHEQAVFLCQAFNTSALFALCEAKFFKTPYASAQCLMSPCPFSIKVLQRKRLILEVSSAGLSSGEAKFDRWSGPVFLPVQNGNPARFFYADISGQTTILPAGLNDRLHIELTENFPYLNALEESGFKPEFWKYRTNAIHKKSKTLLRQKLL